MLLGALALAAASIGGLVFDRPPADPAAQALTAPPLSGSEVVDASAVPASEPAPPRRPKAETQPAGPGVVVVVDSRTVVVTAPAPVGPLSVGKRERPTRPRTQEPPPGRVLANDATADSPADRESRPVRINE